MYAVVEGALDRATVIVGGQHEAPTRRAQLADLHAQAGQLHRIDLPGVHSIALPSPVVEVDSHPPAGVK